MKVNIWRRFDPWLFTPAILLTIIGIAFIHSATIGIEQFEELVPRQTIYAALGLGIALVVARFDYRNLLAIHWWIYGVILVLLATIFIAGQLGEAGARRWLLEGAVQPSELVKVLLIVTLAQYLALRKNQIGELRTVLYSLLYMAVP
ncbi:MAG: FtsW/RodA/SpoVE family cell cycle protein, partial [Chloroflexota bacterium]